MPELVIEGETGEICEVARKHLSPSLSYYYIPDVNSIHEKMEKLFNADRVLMGQKARAHVVENYNIDKLFVEKWIPLYETLQKDILGDIINPTK